MLYGYARVSTDKQEHSADAQHDRLAVCLNEIQKAPNPSQEMEA